MEKRDYWKVVSPEFPGGIICENLAEAKSWAEDERDGAGKGEVYIRKVRFTEEYRNSLPEAD